MEKYSKALKFMTIRDYEFEMDGEDMHYSNPFYFHDKIYLFGSTIIKKLKKQMFIITK